MVFLGDYHTHTKYSDGFGTVSENVEAAALRGLKEVAITEHGPRNIGVNDKKLWQCRRDVEEVAKQRDDLKVYFGIECDILSERGEIDIRREDYSRFDIMLVGFHRFAIPRTFRDFSRYYAPSFFDFFKHFVSKSVVKRNTRALITAIESNPIDMVAHINNRSVVDVKEVAKVCADNGVYIELNTKHLAELDPIIDDIVSIDGVMFIANSDAHFPYRVGRFETNEAFIEKHGLHDRVVNLKQEVTFRSQINKSI